MDCGTSSRVYHREDLLKGLEQAYKKEKETKRILEGLDDQKDFRVVQNKIYYTRNGRMQLYLLAGKFRDLILQECHNTRYARAFRCEKDDGFDPQRLLLANGARRCGDICGNM